jgi:hypothetical protein
MKSIGQSIITASPPLKPLPSKAILWAAQDGCGNLESGDFDRFPNIEAIKYRYGSKHPSPLNVFGEAISVAQERIWIIDHYFLEPDSEKGQRTHRVNKIIDWIFCDSMKATDIRILTDELEVNPNQMDSSTVVSEFKKCADALNDCRKNTGVDKCNIEVRFNLDRIYPYVHDRFAIIDDELWHFGATVGGFHAQVSAATRGWRASDCKADEFFESAWSKEYLVGKTR